MGLAVRMEVNVERTGPATPYQKNGSSISYRPVVMASTALNLRVHLG